MIAAMHSGVDQLKNWARYPTLAGNQEGGTDRTALLLLVHRRLLALGAEFLALLAVQSLGVGFLGAFERFGAAGLGSLCHRRGSRVRLGGRCRNRLGENGSGE